MRAIATVLLLLGCLSIEAAPIPLPRARKAPAPITAADVAGAWMCRWAGEDYPITFAFTGYQNSVWRGDQWAGTWRVEKGELIVEDGRAGAAPCMTWTVTLARTKDGGLIRTAGTAPTDFALGGRR